MNTARTVVSVVASKKPPQQSFSKVPGSESVGMANLPNVSAFVFPTSKGLDQKLFLSDLDTAKILGNRELEMLMLDG